MAGIISNEYTIFGRNMLGNRTKWYHWGLFIILSFIWGSSFILMKEGMRHLGAYQVASLRILSAGLILLPFSVKAFRAIPGNDLFRVLLSGLLGTFFPAYLFCLAETELDSGIAGILNALTPLFTLLIGAFFFQSIMPLKKWLGVIIGFFGLVLLVLSGQKGVRFQNMHYAGFIILATFFYGMNVNMVSRHLRHISSLHLASVAFGMLITPAALILAISGYFSLNISPETIYSSGASAVLGIFGTAVASILFYILMKGAGPLFASMVTYGIPFVALFWGFLAHESITVVQVACLLLILAGVYLANSGFRIFNRDKSKGE